MMPMLALRLALKSLWHRRSRNLLASSATAMSLVTLIVTQLLIGKQILRGEGLIDRFEADYLMAHRGFASLLPVERMDQASEALRTIGIGQRYDFLIRPYVSYQGELPMPLVLCGFGDPQPSAMASLFAQLEGRIPSGGTAEEPLVMIERGVAEHFSAKLGGKILIEERQALIEGIFDRAPGVITADVYMPLKSLQEIASAEGRVTFSLLAKVRPNGEGGLATLGEDVLRQHVPEIKVVTLQSARERFVAMSRPLRLVSHALTTLVLYLCAIVMFLTSLLMVQERNGEFALLGALGMAPGTVLLQVLFESAVLGLLGAGIGGTATMVIAGLVLPAVHPLFGGMVVFGDFSRALLLCVLAAVCGGLIPAMIAIRIDPQRCLKG